MRKVLILAVLMSGAKTTRGDDTGPHDIRTATGLPAPNPEENEYVTFPRRLPDGKVTVIERTPKGDLLRVVFDRVKHPAAPGDTIRVTPSKATEDDVRDEPKSSRPMRKARRKLQQLVDEMMRGDSPATDR
jgi:hypothetical protein